MADTSSDFRRVAQEGGEALSGTALSSGVGKVE